MRQGAGGFFAVATLVLILAAGLSGCGQNSGSQTATGSLTPTLAIASDVSVMAQQAGPTPFIAFVDLGGASISNLSSVSYTIEPKPGTASKPVSVKYTIEALRNRGRVTGSAVTVPVIGLYANSANIVDMSLGFSDGSSQSLNVNVSTPAYSAGSVFLQPTFAVARAPGSALGFDFFFVKPNGSAPITIIDSDGNIRWAGPTNVFAPVLFIDNGFDIGSADAPVLTRYELDGTTSQVTLKGGSIASFHHDLIFGLQGIFAELNVTGRQEDYLAEISSAGDILKTWDMVSILGDYMRSQGDDPSNFVRPGTDWFHMNSAIYDSRDNSIIVSSRENFVMKLDYASGEIKWIFGDQTKYWYQFPSLRAKALTLPPGALAPVGQHALSITDDGQLLMFNNGLASYNQPSGAPTGVNRNYSAVTGYFIDENNKLAMPGFLFDDNQTVLSQLCSSSYFATDRSLLIDYSQADNARALRMKALNSAQQVVFDFSFPTSIGCTSGWNSRIIPFDNLVFEN